MRSYNPTMQVIKTNKVEVSARLEMRPDNTGRITSIYGELDCDVPPMPPLLEAKYAVLKLCDTGVRIPEVGKRHAENIFYLWLSAEEVKEIARDKT
jgi:hypothetical protein